MISPDRASFLEAAAAGTTFIPVAHSWPADLETPLTTWLKVGEGRPPGVLLESVEGGVHLGRWSVVACDPLWTLTARGEACNRLWRDGAVESFEGNPFDLLRSQLKPYRPGNLAGLPPLGQLYGIWGYEVIRWIEPTVPIHTPAATDPPDGLWMVMDSILIIDQAKRLIKTVAYGDLSGGRAPYLPAPMRPGPGKARIKPPGER
jgi:Anthranilate/para-aminobenzoate synthases component I